MTQCRSARATFEADIDSTFRLLFRKGDPAAGAHLSPSAEIRRDNGWFGGAAKPPSVPRDADLISERDLSIYVAAFARTGFFGSNSWYMNDDANMAYAARARDGGVLTLPVLFLHAACDYICQTMDSDLVEPMRDDCVDLTELVIPSGHWMAQEQPAPVNAALAKWLATNVPEAWPG